MLILATSLTASLATGADMLQSFNIDPAQSSVSGLSSGAYMAGQFHVAFSSTVMGAGIIAGGPYNCAEGSLALALNRCMKTGLGIPNPARLLDQARDRAERGQIDPVAGLAEDRVYVFSGTDDDTVLPPVVAQVPAFYLLAGLPDKAIAVVDDLPAGHAIVTVDTGKPCSITESPFINDCDYDQAGKLLEHIHGPLNPPSPEPGGALIEFDQTQFLPDPTAHGMAEVGFVYVPSGCAAGAKCRVHVAFHGCRQTVARVGDAFIAQAGYNRWADTNRLIVLYPQAHETPANPNACWDWWGYDDPDYATQSGRQMAAIHAMLVRLTGGSDPAPFCEVYTGYNFEHWRAGRARFCAWWRFCATGSGEVLGFALNTSTLYESPPGSFGMTPCNE